MRCLRLQFAVPLDGNIAQPVHHTARARRDQVADDDVFLEPLEPVFLARDRGLGQDARRLLEGRGGDERLRLQAGLGDAQKHGCGLGWFAAFVGCFGVDLLELATIQLFSDQEHRVSAVCNLHLLQHLANNDLDVLVIYLHALQAVDLLNFLDQVMGQHLDAKHSEDVVGHWVAIHQRIAGFHVIAFLNADVLAPGDQIFLGLALAACRDHDDAALGLVVLTELDAAVGFGDDGMVLRLAGFEQLRHPWQAAGDVPGFGRLARYACQHVAGIDFLPVLHRKDGVHGHEIAGLQTVGESDNLALRITQRDPRPEVHTLGLLLPVDDDLGGDSGGLVEPFHQGYAFRHVHVIGDARFFGNDGKSVRIPFRQPGAALDLFLGLDE